MLTSPQTTLLWPSLYVHTLITFTGFSSILVGPLLVGDVRVNCKLSRFIVAFLLLRNTTTTAATMPPLSRNTMMVSTTGAAISGVSVTEKGIHVHVATFLYLMVLCSMPLNCLSIKLQNHITFSGITGTSVNIFTFIIILSLYSRIYMPCQCMHGATNEPCCGMIDSQ